MEGHCVTISGGHLQHGFVNRALNANKTHTVISHQDVTSGADPEHRHIWRMTISGSIFSSGL